MNIKDDNLKYTPLTKGFNEEQYQQYSEILGYSIYFDTGGDKTKQEEIFKVMKMIMDMDSCDFFSKLEKIHALIDTNKSFKEYNHNIFKTLSHQ